MAGEANACSYFFAYDIRISMCDLMISDKMYVKTEEECDRRSGTCLFLHAYISSELHFCFPFQLRSVDFYTPIEYSVVDLMSASKVSDSVTFLCSTEYVRARRRNWSIYAVHIEMTLDCKWTAVIWMDFLLLFGNRLRLEIFRLILYHHRLFVAHFVWQWWKINAIVNSIHPCAIIFIRIYTSSFIKTESSHSYLAQQHPT